MGNKTMFSPAQLKPQDKHTHAAQAVVYEFAKRHAVAAAYVFGSQVRGTAHAESDTDVAVLLAGDKESFIDLKIEMAGIAFDVMLETGVLVQALPIWQDEWMHPETHTNPSLVRNIQREGIKL